MARYGTWKLRSRPILRRTRCSSKRLIKIARLNWIYYLKEEITATSRRVHFRFWESCWKKSQLTRTPWLMSILVFRGLRIKLHMTMKIQRILWIRTNNSWRLSRTQKRIPLKVCYLKSRLSRKFNKLMIIKNKTGQYIWILMNKQT